MLPCIWKKYLGVDCMGCGFQRAMELLLNGEFVESVALFPAGIPVLLTLLFLVYHLIFRPFNGANILTVLFIVAASIMVTHFIFKMIFQF